MIPHETHDLSGEHPNRRFASYELLEKLGQGGMGTVYKARRVGEARPVALKIASTRVAQDPVLRKRFEHECVFSCRFQHPRLVSALAHGEEKGVPYLVMEYVAGRPLSRVIKERGRLPEGEALALAGQVGEALTFLHRYQLVHRDVKPENILVTPDGQAKLADLGLIKDLESNSKLTKTSTGLGTFEYSAPEQYEDAKHADARSDVFSLAATLYSALTGMFPFGSGGNMTILHRKLTNDFEAPCRINSEVSEAVNSAICRALQARRDDRPTSIAEFLVLLRTAPAPESAPIAPHALGQRSTPTKNDRRVTIRFAVDLESSCEPIHQGRRDTWKATVQDVSRNGLCLRVQRRFETGTLLRVTIPGLPQDTPDSYLVRVCWVKEQSQRVWLLGCALPQALPQKDVDALCFEGACKTRTS